MDGWKLKFKIQYNFIFQQQQCLCLSFQRPWKKKIEKVSIITSSARYTFQKSSAK